MGAFLAGIGNTINPAISGAVAGGGGGFMSNLNNLFQNKLFLQYLSGIGADLMQNTPGKNLNQITQQNIQSQNFMGLLSKMLRGEVPEGGKITMDESGTKIHVPKLKTEGGFDLTQQGAAGRLNPFAPGQQGISASDLAGLSPQDISQALQFKFAQEELGDKKISQMVDVLYRLGVLPEYYQGMLKNEQAGLALREDAQFRQWYETLTKDERTDFKKNYDDAVAQGYKGSLVDFKLLSNDPETIRLYNAAVADGSFKGGLWDFIKARAAAGATSINLGPYERTMETQKALRESDILAPEFADKSKTGLMKDDRNWRSSSEAKALSESKGTNPDGTPVLSYEDAKAAIQRAKHRADMDAKIRQVYKDKGTITRDAKGWYLNGQLIVRDPYATVE